MSYGTKSYIALCRTKYTYILSKVTIEWVVISKISNYIIFYFLNQQIYQNYKMFPFIFRSIGLYLFFKPTNIIHISSGRKNDKITLG